MAPDKASGPLQWHLLVVYPTLFKRVLKWGRKSKGERRKKKEILAVHPPARPPDEPHLPHRPLAWRRSARELHAAAAAGGRGRGGPRGVESLQPHGREWPAIRKPLQSPRPLEAPVLQAAPRRPRWRVLAPGTTSSCASLR